MIYQQQIPKDFCEITAVFDQGKIILMVSNNTHYALIECENADIAAEEMRSLLKRRI